MRNRAGLEGDPPAGWQRIDAFFDRDGVCGFRLIPATKVEELRSRLTERNCRFDTWDVLLSL